MKQTLTDPRDPTRKWDIEIEDNEVIKMTDKAQRKIKELDYTMGNIILSTHIPLEKRVTMIKEVMEANDYRKLPKEKPRLLSDEEIARIERDCTFPDYSSVNKEGYCVNWGLFATEVIKAQWDICIKHYGG